MSDWRDDDDGRRLAPTTGREPAGDEGVRVLGSGLRAATTRRSAGRLPDDGATWSASSEGAPRSPAEEPSGSMPLPHWTEPPDRRGAADRSATTRPTTSSRGRRSRAAAAVPHRRLGDWAAEDFEAGSSAHDDSTSVGALADDDRVGAEADGPPRARP